MEIKDLEEKVAKATEKVEKSKKTIERHEQQLAKKLKALEKFEINADNMEEKKWLGGTAGTGGSDHYWEICQIESKQEDIIGANKKLKEAEAILDNWKAKLNKEVEKERFLEGNAPQVIKDFLEKWKTDAYEWHIRNFKRFIEVRKELKESQKNAKIEYIESHPEEFGTYLKEDGKIREDVLSWISPRLNRGLDAYLKENNLSDKSIFAQLSIFGAMVQKMDTYRDEAERLEWLDRELERDKKIKMLDLIERISAVVGTIIDASYLRVNEKGNLDGLIIGENGKANIETIGAGGYNIQCFHFRTLVHELK